jgi:hypothetical protein
LAPSLGAGRGFDEKRRKGPSRGFNGIDTPWKTLTASTLQRVDRPFGGRRIAGAVVAGLLAVSFSMIFASPALAAVKTMTTNRSLEAWYWSSNEDIRGCTPEGLPSQIPGLCPSANLTPASPISPGHLGVSMKAGQSDMRAYMLFDLSSIPLGSTVGSMVVTFTVSRSDPSNTEHTTEHTSNPLGSPDQQPKAPATMNDSGARIDACLVTVGWGEAEGAPPADRNADDPTTPVPTEPDAHGGIDKGTCVHGKNNTTTWTFDITPMAKKWVSGAVFNNGFALLPVGGTVDTWTVELHGAYYANAVQNPATGETSSQVFVGHAEEAKARLDYIAAAVQVPVTVPAAVPPSLSSGPSLVSAPTPPASVPPAPAPPTPQAPQPVAQSGGSTPWYVWLVLPLGLFGFVTVSRVLGSESLDSGNRVAQVLRERRIQTSGAS